MPYSNFPVSGWQVKELETLEGDSRPHGSDNAKSCRGTRLFGNFFHIASEQIGNLPTHFHRIAGGKEETVGEKKEQLKR